MKPEVSKNWTVDSEGNITCTITAVGKDLKDICNGLSIAVNDMKAIYKKQTKEVVYLTWYHELMAMLFRG